jgi:HK97 family phage major capsid protein
MESATLKMARLTTDPTAQWLAEAAAMTPSDPVFDAVTLTSKTLRCQVVSSRELLADAPNIDAQLSGILYATLALELDRAGLIGSGSGAQPLGLFGTSGIATVSMGTNGATVTNYDPFVDALTALRNANAATPTAWVMAPRTAGQLDKLKATDNQPLVPPARVSGIPQLQTTSIPVNQTQGTSSDASTVLVGNFAELLIGLRQEITIDVSNQSHLNTYEVAFVASLRADIALVHPASFARIVGLRA